MVSGLRTFNRLAASSMASGRPSSLGLLISATAGAFWLVMRKPGRMAAARSANKAAASD